MWLIVGLWKRKDFFNVHNFHFRLYAWAIMIFIIAYPYACLYGLVFSVKSMISYMDRSTQK
jgi:Ni,Fe-hydrogenase I cytochrome b subunit